LGVAVDGGWQGGGWRCLVGKLWAERERTRIKKKFRLKVRLILSAVSEETGTQASSCLTGGEMTVRGGKNLAGLNCFGEATNER